MIIKDIDITELVANSDKILWSSQQELENIVKQSFNARQLYTDARYTYEILYAQKCKELKIRKEPVTIIKEIAKYECREEYKEMIDCENIKKKLRILLMLFII